MDLPELTDAAQVQALLLNPRYANPFARAFIALCIAAHLRDPSTIPGAIEAVPGPLNGRWECSWGPVLDPDGSNLAVIATLRRKSTNVPLMTVVVIRGTDTSTFAVDGTTLGDIEQIVEDLGVIDQVPLPWLGNSHPARIAAGTWLGVEVIMRLRDPSRGNLTIADYLKGTLTGPPQGRAPILVTGHSLGGCLTSVFAPYLVDALKDVSPRASVCAVSFAGPSAGNADFAAYLSDTVNIFTRYYNTLDVIPNWWANLKATNSIYVPNGLPTPFGMILGDDLFNAIDPVYEQPSPGRALTGAFLSGLSWKDEAEHQHDARTYQVLVRLMAD